MTPSAVPDVAAASLAAALTAPALPHDHPLDHLSLGKIVQIRERLLAAQAAGKRVYRFESGDPSFAPAPHVVDAITQAAHAGKTHYVPNNGIPELRRALARKVADKNGLTNATSDDVFVTNGAMHALFVAFGALLLPGDEVIIPDPMWTEVAENIRLAGGVPVGVPLRAADDYAYRVEDIRAAITPRTTTIFLNTPHNPTGAVLSANALAAILELAREHDLWVVSDEAYEDVIYAPNVHYSIGALTHPDERRVVSIFSFSKSHAMSGLRTGYIVTSHPVLQDRIPKLLRCTINGVNSIAQWAALAAVTGSDRHILEMREVYHERRDTMLRALTGIPGVRPFAPRGAFYVWAELDPSLYERLEVDDADALATLLADQGIGSAPGDAFGNSCSDALRFAFSCDTTMVREGSVLLREALS
ncbi:MAG TPA: aminotransferase class I/II-fold pyridoxal phosphate-dependent enzyme [Gemmatimonadaceae bacterium]|nr:aminotransferase class I/II-fold pyridoxal phosphate-dependent enzyme [Gemmatimonadaceae bacterium]